MTVETVPKDILDKLNAGITISNVDFDIRDLVYTQDSIEVFQDTFANCKVEAHAAAGQVIPTGIHGWDGSAWETLNTDTANRLLVAATGDFYPVTQPVSGTFWQVTQPVSGTFYQVTQPVSGTFYQVTQPVSATDLDIRDLTSVSDSVEVKQSTAANLKTEIANPAGVILGTGNYGSSDGGTTWYPNRVDASGHLQVDVLSSTGVDEWKYLVDTGDLIIRYEVVSNGTTTLHTVTAGKVFYLFSAITCGVVNAANENYTAKLLDDVGGGHTLMAIHVAEGITSRSQTLSLTHPIKYVAGDIISISSGNANLTSLGTIIGYEVAA